MNEPNEYDALFEYDITCPAEIRAYKLTLLWVKLSRDFFPDYKHAKMRTAGDPRKSLIFKYCYALQRKSQGILEESDYPLYVRAQLEILKHITKGNQHARIEPSCLTGDKAWVRWKLWKRKYDERSQVIEDKLPIPAPQRKMADALDRTKDFLVQSFGGDVRLEKLREAVQNKNLHRWVKLGKVSPYYLVLSDLVAQATTDVDGLASMDLDVFRQVITPEIRVYFRELFRESE